MILDKKTVQKIILILCSGILFFVALEHLDIVINGFHSIVSLFFPFLVGGIIAFIFNVPMSLIEKRLFQKTRRQRLIKLRRVLAYIITLIAVLGIIVVVIFIVAPELTLTIKSLVKQVPEAFQKSMDSLKEMAVSYPQVEGYLNSMVINWQDILQNSFSWLQNGAGGMISSGIGIVTNVVSGITTFLIGFVFSVYVLFQKENLSRQSRRVVFALFPDHVAERIVYISSLSYQTFANFLSGQCLEACILGTMFFITMSILQLPYPLLVGILIAVTALVPIVGAFLGCFIGAILIVIIDPMQALIFVIMFLILQQIEGNLIYPHVVGNSVGLPSMWVLASVTIGGKLFGVFGMLIFIPICSVVYVLFREFINKRLRMKRNRRTD